jgi:hypothetical protein
LLKLIDNIYKEGIFPGEFNLCKIHPIIKNFNKANDDLNNIRPISILFERLVLNKNYNNFNTKLEKAFDKLWRDGLFYKFITKLNVGAN